MLKIKLNFSTTSNCFMWDSGTSCGAISGHNGAVNALAHSPERPFRVATAGEDQTILFHEGVPYKFSKTIRTHSNFVNCVRYSPKGLWRVPGKVMYTHQYALCGNNYIHIIIQIWYNVYLIVLCSVIGAKAEKS